MFMDWLNPAGRRPSGWWRPAVKAALLGAPLVATLLAVTVARANRPLVGAADFPLLWLYFAPIAAVLLFALDAVVAWLNGALSRRLGTREGEGTRAALIAGLPTLAYLVVLMRWRPGEQSFLYEALFFVLAVATVVAVSWLAGLVSVADILARTGKVVGSRRRSLRTVFAVVFVVLLAAVTARSLTTADRPDEGVPTFDVVPAAPLIVIGIDGLDSEWIESLASTGAVERLLGRMESGTVVPLSAGTQGSPPAIWTSMMTGVSAESHGVRGVGAERVPGVATPLERSGRALPLVEALRFLLPTRTVPVTGAARRVRTLWEILGLRRSTLSVGWWGSWPAEPEEGGGAWVVSDRVLPKLLAEADWDRDTWPPPLFDTLAGDFTPLRDDAITMFQALPVGDLPPEVREALWDVFLIDAFGLGTVELLWGRADFESAFVYLPGLDILRARFAGESGGLPILARARVLEAYTAWLDAGVSPPCCWRWRGSPIAGKWPYIRGAGALKRSSRVERASQATAFERSRRGIRAASTTPKCSSGSSHWVI
jgi:hypothetical protein